MRKKLQAPTAKLQRNSKSEFPLAPTTYTQNAPIDWTVGEDVARHPFDLEERTARFGEAIILFSKRLPRSPANDRLSGQIVGAGTSVGANYCEANEGVSKKDFRNTIGRCVKEAKETKFFLRMIATAEPGLAADARRLYREAKELHLIFASIYRNTKP